MKKLLTLVLASSFFLSGCQNSTTPTTTTATPQPIAMETTSPSSTPLAQDPVLTPVSVIGDSTAELPPQITLVADHTGKPQGAFLFPGREVGLTGEVNINPDVMPECTLVTWAKYTGEPDAGTTQQVVSHDDGGYDRSIGLDSRAGQWGWSFFAGNQQVVGGFPVEPGQWTKLVAVYNQPAKKFAFYAGDNVMELEEVEFGSGLEATSLGTNPSYGEYFQGEIEPVRVYDRALTPEEIQSLD
jgi:hypothetical protein